MGNRDIAAMEAAGEGARVAPIRLAVAIVLAWLLPGAGHWYLGRRARAGVFFALITASFLLGACLHGRFSVMDRRQPLLSALQVLACLGSGPMEIVARSAVYGSAVYTMPEADNVAAGDMRKPVTVVGRTLRSRTQEYNSSYGTAFLWTAGLMNLLLLLDVYDIAVGRKP